MGAAHVDRIPPHRANGVKNARPHAFRRSAQHRGRPANARFGRPPREGGGVILYGWHTVTAALVNPARRIRKILATENAVRHLADDGIKLPIAPEMVRPDVIAARLSPDAVHQGLLAEADPLPSPDIEDLAPTLSLIHILQRRSAVAWLW